MGASGVGDTVILVCYQGLQSQLPDALFSILSLLLSVQKRL